MVENMNQNNNVCDTCGSGNGRCGKCGNMCGMGGNYILRWIFGILIITWVFSIGMKFGEIKAYLNQSGFGGYGHSYRAMPMMGGVGWSNAQSDVYFTKAVPAAPTMMTSGSVRVINQ